MYTVSLKKGQKGPVFSTARIYIVCLKGPVYTTACVYVFFPGGGGAVFDRDRFISVETGMLQQATRD